MSTLIVQTKLIDKIEPHNNADSLEIAIVGGWQTIVKKGEYKVGDMVVFIPPDSILPESLHAFLSVSQYLGELPVGYYHPSLKPTAKRVKAARLRGEPSYGLVMSIERLKEYCQTIGKNLSDCIPVGFDLKGLLNIDKWEPPVKSTQGDIQRDCPVFTKYTDIENWRNFYDVFCEDDDIVVLEKCHGCLRNDSLIQTIDGEKPIEDVKIGDLVKTYDIERGIFTHEKVSGVLVRDITDKLDWYELEFNNGKTLVCTENHKILTTDGWVEAKNLMEEHVII